MDDLSAELECPRASLLLKLVAWVVSKVGVRYSCNQLSASRHSPVTQDSYKGSHRPLLPLPFPLPFFPSSPNHSTPPQLNSSSSPTLAKILQHRYQYTLLNMPAQIAQPLPTQQMTASSPADAPRAVDEQPVSLTPPHNIQPTNNTNCDQHSANICDPLSYHLASTYQPSCRKSCFGKDRS